MEVGAWDSTVTDREANGNGPTHSQTTLEMVAAQPKQTVIGLGVGSQIAMMTVVGQPITTMDHPNRGQGHSQD